MVPGVHYIPLAQSSVNLSDVLQWTHTHPDDVKRIADAGRAFFGAFEVLFIRFSFLWKD
jgi:hypothetical protein